MLLHSGPSFSIYFGDASDCIFKGEDNSYQSSPFDELRTMLKLHNVVVLNQTHGVEGFFLDSSSEVAAPLIITQKEGDFLVTDKKKVGIGVLTADCLPIVIYDKKAHVVAAVHAGWRGSVAGIIGKTIKGMIQKFDCSIATMSVYFGPCAKVCCYEIQKDFLSHLEKFSYADQVIQHRDDKLYFNLPLFNKIQLMQQGIKGEAIHEEYGECTVNNDSFNSYRRDGQRAGRQITLAFLK
jgi:polyphenol oxidase